MLILDSPEPPKNSLKSLHRQSSSISRIDTFFQKASDKAHEPKVIYKHNSPHKNSILKHINFQSVSPILQSKCKALIHRKK